MPTREAQFRLGAFLIAPEVNEIDGVRIDAKTMDVLVALAEAAPGVISVAQLLDKVWPNVVVGDNVVHQAITHLRKALSDDPRSPRYLQSIPRRGYRLIAVIERDTVDIREVREVSATLSPTSDVELQSPHTKAEPPATEPTSTDAGDDRPIVVGADNATSQDQHARPSPQDSTANGEAAVHRADSPAPLTPPPVDAGRYVTFAKVMQWCAAYIVAALAALLGVAFLGPPAGSPWLGRAIAILLAWVIPGAMLVAWWYRAPVKERLVWREAALIIGCVTLAVVNVGWVLKQQQTGSLSAHSGTQALSGPITFIAANAVAVLPFENLSGRDADAYLSRGFSDELRDQLSRVRGLRVMARGSSEVFAKRTPGTADVAGTLRVATVIEGSLRKDGDRLRISVRLIDAVNGVQVWSESYDRTAGDLLAVQQEIALAAAQQILPQLSAADVPGPQWQASVHDLMLLARGYAQNALRPADQNKVVELYQRIIQIDPRSAAAHARLAKAMLLQGKDVAAAEKHAQRALSLDPNLAEGYAVMGLVLWTQYKHGSGAAYKRAIELNPNDAEAAWGYGHYLALHGSKGSIEYLQRARDLDPMSLVYNADLGWLAAERGDIPGVAEITKLIRQRFPDATGRLTLSLIATTAGQLDEGVAWALEAHHLDSSRADAIEDLAELYARLGMEEAARRVQPLPSLRALFWERRYGDIVTHMAGQDLDEADADATGDLAFALVVLGRDAEAIPLLHAMGLPEIALDDDLRRFAAMNHLMTLISALQATGDNAEATKLALWVQRWLAARNDPGKNMWLPCALAAMGKHEEALVTIEAAAKGANLVWLPYLLDSGCLRSLHADSRYQNAIRIVQARHAALRKRLPLTLAKHGLIETRTSG